MLVFMAPKRKSNCIVLGVRAPKFKRNCIVLKICDTKLLCGLFPRMNLLQSLLCWRHGRREGPFLLPGLP